MKRILLLHLTIFSSYLLHAQNVGIGTSNPQELLSVGANSEFKVNAQGNIMSINNVPYSYPNVQGAAGKTLVNNGAGVLSWQEANIPLGSIITCHFDDTAAFRARGFNIIGVSQYLERGRLNATGTWTPFNSSINTTGLPFSMQDNPSVWSGTEMLVYYNNKVYKWNPSGTVWTASGPGPAFPISSTGSAVWTGTEMIIYDGTRGTRYNPSTNAWTGTAPTGYRTAHSAVWNGTEMILFGGYDGTNALQTINKYNPVINTWAAGVNLTNLPASREGHAAVWTGTRMLVTGGYQGITEFNSTHAYNPSTDTWDAPLASGPFTMHSPKAVWTGSHLLMLGSANFALLNNRYMFMYAYNPITNVWENAANEGLLNHDERSNAVWNGTQMLLAKGSGIQKYSYTGFGYHLTVPQIAAYYVMRKVVSN